MEEEIEVTITTTRSDQVKIVEHIRAMMIGEVLEAEELELVSEFIDTFEAA